MKKPVASLQVSSLRDVVPPNGKEIVVRLPFSYGSSKQSAYEAYKRARDNFDPWLTKPPYSVNICLVAESEWFIDDRGTIHSYQDIEIVGEYMVPR